jgi:hypothetical protein
MEEEVFDYLDFLRESGVINMMGAVPYIMDEFDTNKSEARRLLTKWMKSK